MKRIIIACILGSAAAWSLAAAPLPNVPEPLNKSLTSHGVKSAAWDKGVLRVQLDKPAVSELVYSTFIYHGICAEQWRSTAAFNKMGLTRVEVLDAAGTQGYAFDGDAAVCAEMGNLGKKFGVFIGERTSKCEAGRCAKRN